MFDCWEISSSTASPLPSGSHSGKQIRKSRNFLLWLWWRVQTTQHLAWGREPSPTQHHNKYRASNQSFFLSLFSYFYACIGACSALPRKPHYVGNKCFHTLLTYVWNHQSQYPNQTLCGVSMCFPQGVTTTCYILYRRF